MNLRLPTLFAVAAVMASPGCGDDFVDATRVPPAAVDAGSPNDASNPPDAGFPRPDADATPPAPTFTVGGVVSGLTRKGLVLGNAGKDDLPVTADGAFAFSTPLAEGADYDVTIVKQPEAQTCAVTNGAGKIGGAAVTTIAVACTELTTQIGGERQGLAPSLAGAVSTLAGTPSTKDATGASANFQTLDLMTFVGGALFISDQNNQAIRRLDLATKAVTTFVGGPAVSASVDGTGAAAGIFRPAGVVSDGTSLYVSEDSFCKIRKVVLATGVVTTIAGNTCGASTDGNGTAATFFLPHGLALDGTTLYVAEAYGIRKIDLTTGDVTTLVAGTSGNDDGVGSAAQFQQLWDIVRVGGDLYGSDRAAHTIRKIEIATGAVTTVAGLAGNRTHVDGVGTEARFASPHGLATNGTDLYIASEDANTIRKMVLSTKAVTTVAGASGDGGAVDAVGANARFHRPRGLALDGATLYVSDAANKTIRKVDLATSAVTTLASTRAGVDGLGATARLDEPRQVATDGTNVFVADAGSQTIRKIVTGTGAVTTVAGTLAIRGFADGIGPAARFRNPSGVTTDGTNLYVADSGNNRIRKIVIATGEVSTLAGGSTNGSSTGVTDGIGTAARFSNPSAITMDATHLYVVDASNHAVRKIEIATGDVSTLAGGTHGSADGTATSAQFRYPSGIATDGTNLWVADTASNTIRKIVIATGVVTTVAGGVDVIYGTTDGTGLDARFNAPQGISTDGTNLYITDFGNHTIRKMVIASAVVTTIAGTAGTKHTTDGMGAAARFFYPVGIVTDGTRLFVADSYGATLRVVE